MFQVWALIFSIVEELEVSERRSTVLKTELWGLESCDLLIERYERTRGDILRRSRRKLLSDLTWRMQFDTLLISSDTVFRPFRSYEEHFDVRRIWYSSFGLKEKSHRDGKILYWYRRNVFNFNSLEIKIRKLYEKIIHQSAFALKR